MPQNRTGVWAFSMGTIAATLTLPEEKVDFLIAEGYISDPVAYASRLKELKNKDILLPAGAETFVSLLKKIDCSMLLIAGEQDAFTTVTDSKQITLLGKNRQLLTFPGSHGEGFMRLTKDHFGDMYAAAIWKFTQNS